MPTKQPVRPDNNRTKWVLLGKKDRRRLKKLGMYVLAVHFSAEQRDKIDDDEALGGKFSILQYCYWLDLSFVWWMVVRECDMPCLYALY